MDVDLPGWTIFNINNIKYENCSYDQVVDKLRDWSPLVIHGATEVCPHGEDPGEHDNVVEDDEDVELHVIDCQEH